MAKYTPPEGYLLDTNTGLYYSQVIARNQDGVICQIVTWFNSETGEYSRNIYPVRGDVVRNDEAGRKPVSAGRTSINYILFGLIGVLLIVIVAGSVAIAVKKHGNSEKKLMESAAQLSDGDEMNQAADILEEEAEASYSIDGDYSTVWRDTTERAFVGIHYMTVGQDEEYVYTIKAEGQSWYETDNIPYGALVRINKSDLGDIVTIIPREDPITALAVMGDYIYYGQLTEDGRCDYTRRNKNTGEELFLFSEDYSLLAGDDGVLYFLFAEDDRNQLGMFDVATGEMSYKNLNYDFPAAIEESGNYSLFAPFDINDGMLCLGGHMGDDIIFRARIDLKADEITYARRKGKFLGASLSRDEATPEMARYYRRYGMGAMLGPGEKNPYYVMEEESNGVIGMYNYFADMDPALVETLDKFGSAESQRFNRLEIDLYDVFTGDRAETGRFGHGFRFRLNEYPQMAISFDNYPTGITRDFYIYNNCIVRLEGAHITEIVEY